MSAEAQLVRTQEELRTLQGVCDLRGLHVRMARELVSVIRSEIEILASNHLHGVALTRARRLERLCQDWQARVDSAS